MSGTTTTPTLSIIIVSWNTKELVIDCLESVRASFVDASLEIILVDNASADGTADLVKQRFKDVNVVQNEANLGFAKANNIGLRVSSGEYLCLINSDVVVPPDCLQRMLAYMRQHPDVGMLGPKMVLCDGSVGQSCMRFPTPWNWFCRALALDSMVKGSRLFGDFMMSGLDHDTTTEVDILTGWFWMVRRDSLEQVGLLEEQFFMYGEDIDWPKRFHDQGWRVVFYGEAQALHRCAASSSHAPTRFYIEMNRANMQYFHKHHGRTAIAAFWLAMWLHQIVRVVGYGLLYVVKEPKRSTAGFKVRRSLACLRWLMGGDQWGEDNERDRQTVQ